jgi:D-beta-D-heptose 7-phosphate kinase/D-beta-D-heptose 1-phosphate adenosyltransferase
MDRLKQIIKDFPHARILVIGDIILDRYVKGSVSRISPEAPVPIVEVEEVQNIIGGAGNTANNIVCFGGKAYISGIIGDDEPGRILTKLFKDANIDHSGVFVNDKLSTIQKVRVISSEQQIVRLDYEESGKVHYTDGTDNNDAMCKKFKDMIQEVDIIIVSDYNKGTITREVATFLKDECKKYGKRIIVDTKLDHMEYFKDVYLIKPNQKETEEMTGIKINDDTDAIRAGRKLQGYFNSNIVVTRGSKGMDIFEGREHKNILTRARNVYDVSGAGDTVVAALGLSIASGASLIESAEIANHAAGIVVGKPGTATATREELLEAMKDVHN